MKIPIKGEKKRVETGVLDFAGHNIAVGDWVAVTVTSGYSAKVRLGKISKVTPKGFSYKHYHRAKNEFVKNYSCRTDRFVVIKAPKHDKK